MPRIDEADDERVRDFESVEVDSTAAREPEEVSGSRRKFWLWGLFAVLAVVLVGGFLWIRGLNRETTDDAQVDGHIAPIAAKVPGSVVEVLVQQNQHVKAGEVLVRLDQRDYQARVDQLKAALAVAEAQAKAASVNVPLTRATTASGASGANAQLANADAKFQQAEVEAQQAATSGIAVAQADLAAAEANNKRAQADLERMRPLAAKEEISRQQLDAYVAAAQVTSSQLAAAQERLASARQTAANKQAAVAAARAGVEQARAGVEESRANQQQVHVSSAQAASAEAGILQARANLEAAQLNLSYTTIVAPMDGVVTQKNVERGQILQPGQALMALVPLHDVWVTANFKETQLADVRPGQVAEVKVDMYGARIRGRVDSIASATGSRLSLLPAENATGNFVKVVQRIPVKIVFDNLPANVILRPGMNVDATIVTR